MGAIGLFICGFHETIKYLTSKSSHDKLFTCSGAWCSGQTCGPVKAEIAGSNPVAPAKQRKSCASGFFYCHPDRAGKGFESRTSSVLRDRSRQAKKKLRKRLFLLSPRPGGKRVRIPHFQCAARSLPPSKEKAAQAAFFIVTQTGRWEILSL